MALTLATSIKDLINAHYPIEDLVNAQFPIEDSANAQYPIEDSVNAQYPIEDSVNAQFPIEDLAKESSDGGIAQGMYMYMYTRDCQCILSKACV